MIKPFFGYFCNYCSVSFVYVSFLFIFIMCVNNYHLILFSWMIYATIEHQSPSGVVGKPFIMLILIYRDKLISRNNWEKKGKINFLLSVCVCECECMFARTCDNNKKPYPCSNVWTKNNHINMYLWGPKTRNYHNVLLIPYALCISIDFLMDYSASLLFSKAIKFTFLSRLPAV